MASDNIYTELSKGLHASTSAIPNCRPVWVDQKQRVDSGALVPAGRYLDTISAELFHRYSLKGSSYPTYLYPPCHDRETKTSYREVVDGQQRLTTIVKFIDGKLALDKRSKEFVGKTYATLDDEDQGRLLAYQIGVEQLFGADDDTVLDIFHRINAYGISLNNQELRHGKFQGGRYEGTFRLAVIKTAERWEILWSKYHVVSVRNRVRLLHHELVAQLLGVILNGVTDGGQPKIDKLYERYDSAIPDDAEERFDQVCNYIVDHFSDVLGTKLGAGPHFMMIFAAVAHALFGIPVGDMGGQYPGLPARSLSEDSFLETKTAT